MSSPRNENNNIQLDVEQGLTAAATAPPPPSTNVAPVAASESAAAFVIPSQTNEGNGPDPPAASDAKPVAAADLELTDDGVGSAPPPAGLMAGLPDTVGNYKKTVASNLKQPPEAIKNAGGPVPPAGMLPKTLDPSKLNGKDDSYEFFKRFLNQLGSTAPRGSSDRLGLHGDEAAEAIKNAGGPAPSAGMLPKTLDPLELLVAKQCMGGPNDKNWQALDQKILPLAFPLTGAASAAAPPPGSSDNVGLHDDEAIAKPDEEKTLTAPSSWSSNRLETIPDGGPNLLPSMLPHDLDEDRNIKKTMASSTKRLETIPHSGRNVLPSMLPDELDEEGNIKTTKASSNHGRGVGNTPLEYIDADASARAPFNPSDVLGDDDADEMMMKKKKPEQEMKQQDRAVRSDEDSIREPPEIEGGDVEPDTIDTFRARECITRNHGGRNEESPAFHSHHSQLTLSSTLSSPRKNNKNNHEETDIELRLAAAAISPPSSPANASESVAAASQTNDGNGPTLPAASGAMPIAAADLDFVGDGLESSPPPAGLKASLQQPEIIHTTIGSAPLANEPAPLRGFMSTPIELLSVDEIMDAAGQQTHQPANTESAATAPPGSSDYLGLHDDQAAAKTGEENALPASMLWSTNRLETIPDGIGPLPLARLLEPDEFDENANIKKTVSSSTERPEAIPDGGPDLFPGMLPDAVDEGGNIKKTAVSRNYGQGADNSPLEYIDASGSARTPFNPSDVLDNDFDKRIMKKKQLEQRSQQQDQTVRSDEDSITEPPEIERGNAEPAVTNNVRAWEHITTNHRGRDEESLPVANDAINNLPVDVDQHGMEDNVHIEDDANPRDGTVRPDLERNSTIHIPEAFLVEEQSDESDDVEVIIATQMEPTLPWWKQRQPRMLLCMVFFLLATLAISLGVALQPNPTAVLSTPSPSSYPTVVPSSSLAPSSSPSECVNKTLSNSQKIDLIIDQPTWVEVAVDGRNMFVLVGDSTSSNTYLIFYAWVDDKWIRRHTIQGEYDSTRYVALSGKMAFVGFPHINNNAGAVFVYKQNRMGDWEKVEDPFIFDIVHPSNSFGEDIGIDGDLACVSDMSHTHLFRRNDTKWVQFNGTDGGECSIAGDTIVVGDYDGDVLRPYKYDADLNGVVPIQDPIQNYSNTGSMSLSRHYLFYVDGAEDNVVVYHREESIQPFSFIERLNVTANSWSGQLALENDILVVGGKDHTHIFSEQNGHWEETITIEESYRGYKLSGRHLVATTNSEVRAFNIEGCAQAMPTQMPSSSIVPTVTPTTLPSSSPSSSAQPSTSAQPTMTDACNNTHFVNKADLQQAITDYESCTDDNCTIAQTYGYPMNTWCVGNITDMSELFSGKSKFNEDISDWDTASVTTMSDMFYAASSFNKPIGGWNTSSVRTMGGIFWGASSFNQPIGGWDTSRVRNMQWMFARASKFDQPIEGWDTSSVNDMNYMFYQAYKFDRPLEGWDTSSVTDMSGMFHRASSFDQPIGGWNTSSVTDMSDMFLRASSFNKDLCAWGNSYSSNVVYSTMFSNTQCESQYDPSGPQGPWCKAECYWQLKSGTGLCLDVPAYDTSNGVDLIAFQCNDGDNQLWTIDDKGYIRSKLNHNKCIDPEGPSTANGSPVQLWDCESDFTYQMWNMDSTGGINSKHSPGQCVGIGEQQWAGAMIMWECHGGKNQQWSQIRQA